MGGDAIADFLGITRRQVYRLVYDGHLPSFKLGGTIAARKSSLSQWLLALDPPQPSITQLRQPPESIS
ncbi:helix-turn-helix domain-containing protein [Ensifer adhaerens]|uniref:helix-turn-helix domain-containing protein n=1 Tax=Ensifer adhaerens TaxID=106592 RepID=UPI001F2C479D|nr:helix-turn-helix domain-containing protein [Ensifer adhaerens]MDF8353215.1 helix-turn-helix domain-containing protein [Ensifer adhaerens]